MDTKVLIKLRSRGVSMSKISNGRYTKEFREEAVRMVVTGGHSAGSATHEDFTEKGRLPQPLGR